MTSGPELHLILPGPLEQRTGGYVYDAHIVTGLRRLGWQVRVHSLDGRFPEPNAQARASSARVLSTLPDGARVIVDGLALPGLSPSYSAHFERLQLLALVHHLTHDETGLNELSKGMLYSSEREVLSRCLGVIVTSEFTASRVRHLGIPETLIRAVQPGIEPVRPARGPGPGAPPQLLCVGSVIPRKGQDILVRALTTLKDESWSCVCAGSLHRDPGFATEVRRLTEKAGLSGRMHFLGECNETRLEELYYRSSVFVLPSHFEGFGMALSEALARGLPVISTTGGAIPYTVPPDAGILVPPGDHESLAEAIAQLLGAPRDDRRDDHSPGRERRVELAAAARRHAATLPDWDHQARVFADAVMSLTSDPS